MTNKRKFMKCDICGNIIGMIHDSGVTPVCCGQKMTELVANTVDASYEKHIPVVTRDGNKVHVVVGGDKHPMVEEHYIEWIVVAGAKETQRYALKAGDEPEANFLTLEEGPITVFAYCNLHGLWVAEA